MQSYSENQLDERVLKYLMPLKNKIFIEAGANNGVWQSNTLLYERHFGWTGLLIEPNHMKASECRYNRPKSIVENYALVSSAYKETTIDGYFQFQDFENSLCAQVVTNMQAGFLCPVRWKDTSPIKVPAIALKELLKKHDLEGTKVDFFSLDVEGYETHVLDGLDLKKNRPFYILMELPNEKDSCREDMMKYMKQNEYTFIENLSDHDDLFRRNE
jgi:FkbM family methyltransferase